MSIKFINFLMIQKISNIQEKDVCNYLSSILWNLNLPKKKSLTPRSSEKQSNEFLKPKNINNFSLNRKSCKPQILEQPLSTVVEPRSNRSRSLDTGAGLKAYQKDLLDLKKKSLLMAKQQANLRKETDDEKLSVAEKYSDKGQVEEELSSSTDEEIEKEKPEQEKKIEEVKNQDFNTDNLGIQFLNNDYENIPQAPSMSNKRKPKLLDFGQIETKNKPKAKSGFDFRLKIDEEQESHPQTQMSPKNISLSNIKTETIENNNKDGVASNIENDNLKPSLKTKKPAFKGKFNLELKEDKNDGKKEENEKKIEINPVPQINIISPAIMDNQNQDVVLDIPSKKIGNRKASKSTAVKKTFAPILSIDTEQINENYSYGGEKGKKLAMNLVDELSEEYREIAELAVMCVKYMNGELKNDDYFANKMPVIKRFDAPQSCRGLKTVSFPDKAVSNNNASNNSSGRGKKFKECIKKHNRKFL